MQIKAGIKGELAEEYLYEFVNANRGLSIYELSERLGWNVEELHAIIERLEEDGLFRTDESEEEELKRKVYPVGWKDLLPEDVKKSFSRKAVLTPLRRFVTTASEFGLTKVSILMVFRKMCGNIK